jgi:hypothetical protein
MESGDTSKLSADQRKEALRKLAQNTGPYQPPDIPNLKCLGSGEKNNGKREPKRRLLVVAALAIAGTLISVVGGVFIHLQRTPVANNHTTAPITPRLNGLDCAQDIAWSPDGARVAIVGYQNTCGQDDVGAYASVPGWVTIYDTSSKRLLTSFSPGPAIDHAPGVSAPAIATPQTSGSDVTHPAINYLHLSWAPDGKSLALSFEVNEWITPVSHNRLYGLAIVNSANGLSEHVFTHIASPNDPAYLEWDLTSGKLLPAVQATQTALSNLPTGQDFLWGKDGAIMAKTDTPGSISPAGEPDGAASFSIWQPGQATLIQLGGPTSSAICAWQSSFAAWSPNGRYILATAQAGGVITTPGCHTPSKAELANSAYAGSSSITPHDNALAALYSRIISQSGAGTSNGQSVAWRPDGKAMAIISSDETNAVTPSNRTVTIYNSATGQVIAKLTPQANIPYAFDKQSNPMLRWSPDGSRLLLLDSQLGVVTIWDRGDGLPV